MVEHVNSTVVPPLHTRATIGNSVTVAIHEQYGDHDNSSAHPWRIKPRIKHQNHESKSAAIELCGLTGPVSCKRNLSGLTRAIVDMGNSVKGAGTPVRLSFALFCFLYKTLLRAVTPRNYGLFNYLYVHNITAQVWTISYYSMQSYRLLSQRALLTSQFNRIVCRCCYSVCSIVLSISTNGCMDLAFSCTKLKFRYK